NRALHSFPTRRSSDLERLEKLEKELANLKEDETRLTTHWQQEKDAIQRSRKLKEEIEQVRNDMLRAQQSGDYATASELQYGRLRSEEHTSELQSLAYL